MTDTKESGGPAFPRPAYTNGGNPGDPFPHHEQDGMALRDYFAAKAMQGDWAAQSPDLPCVFTAKTPQRTLEDSAALYYRMADAMLKARQP